MRIKRGTNYLNKYERLVQNNQVKFSNLIIRKLNKYLLNNQCLKVLIVKNMNDWIIRLNANFLFIKQALLRSSSNTINENKVKCFMSLAN